MKATKPQASRAHTEANEELTRDLSLVRQTSTLFVGLKNTATSATGTTRYKNHDSENTL